MQCCNVSFFQQRGHSIAIHRVCLILVVAFRTTVKETAVKLVSSVRLCAPPVDRKFSYPLPGAINLMADCASVLSRFPSEPLDTHLPERLCLLRAELLFLWTTCVAYHPVGMSRISAHRHRALASYATIDIHVSSPRILVTSLVMVAVKYHGRTTDDIVFDE